jgi:hypothetical protein
VRIYVIGSLRNDNVPDFAESLRSRGHEVFDNWHAAGPIADDSWQKYSERRGRTYKQALESPEAKHVFEFDKRWLEWAEAVVMLLPAGRSGWGELMWSVGRGKPGYIYVAEEPERYDVMAQFATGVYDDFDELCGHLLPAPPQGILRGAY